VKYDGFCHSRKPEKHEEPKTALSLKQISTPRDCEDLCETFSRVGRFAGIEGKGSSMDGGEEWLRFKKGYHLASPEKTFPRKRNTLQP
jgi:hypothetical protein